MKLILSNLKFRLINFFSRLSDLLAQPKFLIGHALISTTLTAALTGSANDEGYYRQVGLYVLNTHDFGKYLDHPPFFMWLGSLAPWITFSDSLQLSRLSNLIIFGYFLNWGYQQLRRELDTGTAYYFVLLFALCPNIKAHAAIHGNDFMPSMAIGFATIGLLTWPPTAKNAFILAFVFGLSVMSKISMAFYAPFLVLSELFRWRSLRVLLVIGLGVACSLVLTYHFDLSSASNFVKSVEFQLTHNRGGHSQYFWGTVKEKSIWYYYLLLLVFKLPFLHLILLSLSALRSHKVTLGFNKAFITWFPALALLFTLSLIDVQLGLRYFLPGLTLIYIGAATFLAKQFLQSKALKILIVLTFLSDLSTLLFGSYLSYFNALTPQPTRNFSDSNIDWGQDLPEHLKGLTLGYKSLGEPIQLFESPSDVIKIRIGASELNGHWGQRVAQQFRLLQPQFILAGFEFFKISKNHLFEFYLRSSLFPQDASAQCSGDSVFVSTPADLLQPIQWQPHQDQILFLNYEDSTAIKINDVDLALDRNWAWIMVPQQGLKLSDWQGIKSSHVIMRSCNY